MGEVNCHCRKTKALAVQSQGEIWAAGTFLYSGPSRRLCSSLLRQRLLCLDLRFIMSRVASCWHIPCVVGCRGYTEQGTKQGGKNPCFKSHECAQEAARGKNGECSSHSHTSFVCVATSIPPCTFPGQISMCWLCTHRAGTEVSLSRTPQISSQQPASCHASRPSPVLPKSPPTVFPKGTCSFLFEHSDLSLSSFFLSNNL